jgi:hypothetical protein
MGNNTSKKEALWIKYKKPPLLGEVELFQQMATTEVKE